MNNYKGYVGSFMIQSIIHFLSIGILLLLAVLSIYCLILFIRLALRGIKAVDIYIAKNRNQ